MRQLVKFVILLSLFGAASLAGISLIARIAVTDPNNVGGVFVFVGLLAILLLMLLIIGAAIVSKK